MKQQILELVGARSGSIYWYGIDRVLSSRAGNPPGPYFREIDELIADGSITARPTNEPGGVRYWITEKGRTAIEAVSPAESG